MVSMAQLRVLCELMDGSKTGYEIECLPRGSYNILYQMTDKGLLQRAEAVVYGRNRVYYSLTKEGRNAMAVARYELDTLWRYYDEPE